MGTIASEPVSPDNRCMKWGYWVGLACIVSAAGCVEPLSRTVISQTTTRTMIDTGVFVDAARDVAIDVGTDAQSDAAVDSRAGAACTDDSMCDGLACDRSVRGGFCTAPCSDSTAQANERAECGGRNSTCLARGDGAEQHTFCTNTCRPAAAMPCRAGFVCTGFWHTHEGATPDSVGCAPFCTTDEHCNPGERCTPRTGKCATTAAPANGLADGMPCAIPRMNERSPCRGECFRITDASDTGVCGSLINLATNRECPDEPLVLRPIGRSGSDNLGLCIFRTCSATQCCPSGLTCETQVAGDPEGICTVDGPTDPNIECAMPSDAATDASDASDAGDGE